MGTKVLFRPDLCHSFLLLNIVKPFSVFFNKAEDGCFSFADPPVCTAFGGTESCGYGTVGSGGAGARAARAAGTAGTAKAARKKAFWSQLFRVERQWESGYEPFSDAKWEREHEYWDGCYVEGCFERRDGPRETAKVRRSFAVVPWR